MYAKIYHRILTDPKTAGLSLAELGAYTVAITWCSREETDGRFTYAELSSGCRFRALRRSLERLVTVGLLSCDGPYYVVNTYLKYQTSKASIQEKRATARDKKAAQRSSGPLGTAQVPNTKLKVQSPKGETPKPPRAKSGKTVCPEDFQPRPQDAEKARAAGVNVETLVAEMVDWSASDKTKNRKSDWHAVFRQWSRKRVAEHKQRTQLEERKDARYGVKAETEHDRQYSENQRKVLAERKAQEEKLNRYVEEYRRN